MSLKSIHNKLSQIIRNNDRITMPVKHKIHMDNDTETLTICGGFLTLLAQFFILYVAVSEGLVMINNERSYLVMTKKTVGHNDPLIMTDRSLKDLNKLTFYFKDHKLNNIVDYHKYVSFKVEHSH